MKYVRYLQKVFTNICTGLPGGSGGVSNPIVRTWSGMRPTVPLQVAEMRLPHRERVLSEQEVFINILHFIPTVRLPRWLKS